MQGTGIVRRLDDLGRIVLPRDVRRIAGLEEGTPMEILAANNSIVILKKYQPSQSPLMAVVLLENEIDNDLVPEVDRKAILRHTAEIRSILTKNEG